MSDEVDLIRFDLAASEHFPRSERVVRLRASRGGRAEGLLAWMVADYGHGIHLERRPPQTLGVWSPRMHVFAEPLPVRAGEDVRIRVAHDRMSVAAMLA